MESIASPVIRFLILLLGPFFGQHPIIWKVVSFISEFWSIPHFNTASQFCWVHLKFKNPWGAREMVLWYYWKHVGRNWWQHLGGCECCCGKARVRRHLYLERVVVCEALPWPRSHSGSQLPSHISCSENTESQRVEMTGWRPSHGDTVTVFTLTGRCLMMSLETFPHPSLHWPFWVQKHQFIPKRVDTTWKGTLTLLWYIFFKYHKFGLGLF